jgi:hypothetical protein
MTLDPNAHSPRVGGPLHLDAHSPRIGGPALPEPLQSMSERAPLLLIFLRHFG